MVKRTIDRSTLSTITLFKVNCLEVAKTRKAPSRTRVRGRPIWRRSRGKKTHDTNGTHDLRLSNNVLCERSVEVRP